MNKFEGVPSWRMVSLKECADRRQIMVNQFERYGVRDYHFYQSHRYDDYKSPLYVKYHYESAKAHIGTIIAHLENMRHWYLTTNEPYAIFSDDDIDLSTSENWNFNFKEFLDTLPHDWGAVQLIRFMNIESENHLSTNPYDATLKIFWGRWWGVCALMRRSYVRKCLERHIKGPFIYDLRVNQDTAIWDEHPNTCSYAENVLYLDNGIIYNFPLFTELPNESTIHSPDADRRNRFKNLNFDIFRNLWKEHGGKMELAIALNPHTDERPYGVTDNIVPSEGTDSGSTPDKDTNGDVVQ